MIAIVCFHLIELIVCSCYDLWSILAPLTRPRRQKGSRLRREREKERERERGQVKRGGSGHKHIRQQEIRPLRTIQGQLRSRLSRIEHSLRYTVPRLTMLHEVTLIGQVGNNGCERNVRLERQLSGGWGAGHAERACEQDNECDEDTHSSWWCE